MRFGRIAAAVGAMLVMTAAAQAQSAADFYKGKQITLIVGNDAGGGHDVFARVFANHYGRHLPGNPNIVVQNMPGASGIVAANHMANVAPKDGLVIAAIYPANVIEPLLTSSAQIRYDPRTLGWIGNIAALNNTCFTWKDSPVKTLADAKTREVITASGSPTSSSSVFPNVLNQLLGTKFKVITGYPNNGMKLAVERGEVEGICGWGFDTLMASVPSWVEEKQINFLAQSGLEKVKELPDVPMVSDFATGADKAVFRMLDIRTALGRPYLAPPGVPADRLAALRDGFDRTMRDPAYLADAKKAKQDVNPTDHKGMMAVVQEAYAMPKEVLDKVAALTRASGG